MTVGTQATQASINGTLTSLALSLRNDMQNILNFSQWLNTFGPSGLAALGYSSADQATILAAVGNMADLAGIYQGQAAQLNLPFNFMANTENLWGGQ